MYNFTLVIMLSFNHRRNLRGVQEVHVPPTFWRGGTIPPTFSAYDRKDNSDFPSPYTVTLT